MPGISPGLLSRLNETLERCPALSNDVNLRAVFIDARIASWHNLVPDNAPNRARRIKLLIDALCNEYDNKGENALVLFLSVLHDEAPHGTALRAELEQLASELEDALPQPPFWIPGPPKPCKIKQILQNVSGWYHKAPRKWLIWVPFILVILALIVCKFRLFGVCDSPPPPTPTPTPTATVTPTITPTLTLSPTFTPTATGTPTLSPTPTFSPTVTPSSTPTPSPTPTPTRTPSPANTPTFTPAPTCPANQEWDGTACVCPEGTTWLPEQEWCWTPTTDSPPDSSPDPPTVTPAP